MNNKLIYFIVKLLRFLREMMVIFVRLVLNIKFRNNFFLEGLELELVYFRLNIYIVCVLFFIGKLWVIESGIL